MTAPSTVVARRTLRRAAKPRLAQRPLMGDAASSWHRRPMSDAGGWRGVDHEAVRAAEWPVGVLNIKWHHTAGCCDAHNPDD